MSTITTTNGSLPSRMQKMVVFSSHLGNSLYMLCVGRAQTKISVCTCDAAMNLSGTMASDLGDDSIDIERSDPTAEFLELYSHNYPRLQFYLMTLFPFPDDAADVLQETSLVLWRKFDTYTTGTNFFAWACKIARLQALNHRKRRGKAAVALEISYAMEKVARFYPGGRMPTLHGRRDARRYMATDIL